MPKIILCNLTVGFITYKHVHLNLLWGANNLR